eukprot:5809815-Pyramimonas_sp.AAC.1
MTVATRKFWHTSAQSLHTATPTRHMVIGTTSKPPHRTTKRRQELRAATSPGINRKEPSPPWFTTLVCTSCCRQ